MLPTSNPNQKVLSIGIIVAVCVLVGSSYGAYQIGYGNGAGTKTASQTQNAALTESRLVLGTVEKVSGQQITLKDFRKIPIITDSTDQSARMSVTVDQNTIIERLVQKDSATISKERDAFLKKIQAQGAFSSTTAMLQPPEPFTREKLTLGDIKVGDTLAVFAAEDIAKLTVFTAARVEVQVIPAMPAALPKKQ